MVLSFTNPAAPPGVWRTIWGQEIRVKSKTWRRGCSRKRCMDAAAGTKTQAGRPRVSAACRCTGGSPRSTQHRHPDAQFDRSIRQPVGVGGRWGLPVGRRQRELGEVKDRAGCQICPCWKQQTWLGASSTRVGQPPTRNILHSRIWDWLIYF